MIAQKEIYFDILIFLSSLSFWYHTWSIEESYRNPFHIFNFLFDAVSKAISSLEKLEILLNKKPQSAHWSSVENIVHPGILRKDSKKEYQIISWYFNQANLYADKMWRCSQHIQWKYPLNSLLAIFLDVTLFLNMIYSSKFDLNLSNRQISRLRKLKVYYRNYKHRFL